MGIDATSEILQLAQVSLSGIEERANQIQLSALETASRHGENIKPFAESILTWIKGIDSKARWGKFGLWTLCLWQLEAQLLDLGEKQLAAQVINEMRSGENKSHPQQNFEH